MERLTKMNERKTAHFYPQCFDECGGIGYSRKCDSCDFLDRVCDKLGEYEDLEEQGLLMKLPCKVGEYEDLEEQGLLMKLPCKVGDTMYFPYVDTVTKEKIISEEKVTEIGLYYRVGNGELDSCSEIGQIIFLTHAEAEEALRKLKMVQPPPNNVR